MSKTKNQVNDLLAAIARQPTPTSAQTAQPKEEAPRPRTQKVVKQATQTQKPTKDPVVSKVGKAVQFWMHDEDRKLVRELSAWLAGQGVRPTDSMVIRACLRFAKAGGGFLEAYWEAAKLDGRLKRD